MKKLLILFLLSFAITSIAEEPVSTGWVGSTAIGGHDSAAYHHLKPNDQAVSGVKIHQVEWKGASWYFATEQDKQAFEANPERYAPAYNGHCANALSLGEGLISTNGKHWAVFDNQLYLFYAARGAKRWLSGDYHAYKEEADRAWQVILSGRK